MARLGIYGGSFDPPHVAHVLAAAYALSTGDFVRVLVVPVFAHAFNKQLAPFEHRVRMCERAFADLSRVTVSRIESELPAPNRTLSTLHALRSLYPGFELGLIIGSDVLPEASKWHAFDAVTELAPPFVLGRAGHDHPDAPPCALPAISSTRVRSLLSRAREPEAARELSAIVPRAVLEYAAEHALYERIPVDDA